MNTETLPTVAWDTPVETMLASWCDHAKCYIWMHTRAHDEAEKIQTRFLITLHILSTLSGLSNIITGDLVVGTFKIAWLFGGLTLVLTSLAVLQDKMGIAERVMNHRKLALQSLTIKMKIEEVLRLPREARGDCRTFLGYIRSDIHQSMLEKNAAIPRAIREACYTEFKDKPHFDIPDACGQVEHTAIYVALSDSEGI